MGNMGRINWSSTYRQSWEAIYGKKLGTNLEKISEMEWDENKNEMGRTLWKELWTICECNATELESNFDGNENEFSISSSHPSSFLFNSEFLQIFSLNCFQFPSAVHYQLPPVPQHFFPQVVLSKLFKWHNFPKEITKIVVIPIFLIGGFTMP